MGRRVNMGSTAQQSMRPTLTLTTFLSHFLLFDLTWGTIQENAAADATLVVAFTANIMLSERLRSLISGVWPTPKKSMPVQCMNDARKRRWRGLSFVRFLGMPI